MSASVPRKENVMKCRSVILCILSLVVLLLVTHFANPASAATGSLTDTKICVDPGHGGSDPGAIYVDETIYLEEADINLDVSYGLKALLEDAGAVVVMTRTDDSSKTNADRYTFCNEEEATILVSVHTNSVTDPTWDGSMTLYAPSADDALAQAIHDVLYPFLRDTAPDPANFKDFGLDNFASGVLFKCDMPAAMMEPLLMSNPDEAALLVEKISGDNCAELSCRRGQIAQAIHLGILNYFDVVGPPPEPEGTMHVGGIDMSHEQKGPNYFVYTKVAIYDNNGSPVTGAAVSVTTTEPSGSSVSNTANTGDNGTVTFKLRSNQTGSYTSAVSNVSKDGWTYDFAANEETDDSHTVP